MPFTPEQKREWRKLHKTSEDYHEHNIKVNYGITRKEYTEMFEKQKGLCAICEKHQRNFKRRLSVDHCHHTGKIRGLLCASCNSGLGKLGDDVNLLEAAILYLDRTTASTEDTNRHRT